MTGRVEVWPSDESTASGVGLAGTAPPTCPSASPSEASPQRKPIPGVGLGYPERSERRSLSVRLRRPRQQYRAVRVLADHMLGHRRPVMVLVAQHDDVDIELPSALHDRVRRVMLGSLHQLAVHVDALRGQVVDGGLHDLPRLLRRHRHPRADPPGPHHRLLARRVPGLLRHRWGLQRTDRSSQPAVNCLWRRRRIWRPARFPRRPPSAASSGPFRLDASPARSSRPCRTYRRRRAQLDRRRGVRPVP